MQSTAIVKRQRFVEEYCTDFNAKQAAIRAGYSKHTAASQASRLLTNVNVKEQIATIKNSLAQEAGLTALDYWRGLREMMDFDPAELFNNDGTAKNIAEIPLAHRKCLKAMRIKKLIANNGKGVFSEADLTFPDRLAVIKELGNALNISDEPNNGITAVQINIRYDDPAPVHCQAVDIKPIGGHTGTTLLTTKPNHFTRRGEYPQKTSAGGSGQKKKGGQKNSQPILKKPSEPEQNTGQPMKVINKPQS